MTTEISIRLLSFIITLLLLNGLYWFIKYRSACKSLLTAIKENIILKRLMEAAQEFARQKGYDLNANLEHSLNKMP